MDCKYPLIRTPYSDLNTILSQLWVILVELAIVKALYKICSGNTIPWKTRVTATAAPVLGHSALLL